MFVYEVDVDANNEDFLLYVNIAMEAMKHFACVIKACFVRSQTTKGNILKQLNINPKKKVFWYV
jgi:hypothetical protein